MFLSFCYRFSGSYWCKHDGCYARTTVVVVAAVKETGLHDGKNKAYWRKGLRFELLKE